MATRTAGSQVTINPVRKQTKWEVGQVCNFLSHTISLAKLHLLWVPQSSQATPPPSRDQVFKPMSLWETLDTQTAVYERRLSSTGSVIPPTSSAISYKCI